MIDHKLRTLFFESVYSRYSKDIFFIDVGANVGHFSLFVEGRNDLSCLSIEPNPKVFESLKKTIDMKGLSPQIDLINLGMFDKKTTLELKVPVEEAFSGVATFGTNIEAVDEYMGRVGELGGIYKKVSVPCDTLDNIIKERHPTKRISAIKMDVEGAEYFVLKGAVDILKKHKPLLMLECDLQHTVKFDYDPLEVYEFLQQFGYEIIWRGPSDVLLEISNDE